MVECGEWRERDLTERLTTSSILRVILGVCACTYTHVNVCRANVEQMGKSCARNSRYVWKDSVLTWEIKQYRQCFCWCKQIWVLEVKLHHNINSLNSLSLVITGVVGHPGCIGDCKSVNLSRHSYSGLTFDDGCRVKLCLNLCSSIWL